MTRKVSTTSFQKAFTLILRKAVTLEVKKAFTLIEILIVISIMGILITLGSYSWSSVSARSRDNTRKTDLKHISTSLELYYADQRSYPTFDTSIVIYLTLPGN